MTVKVMGLARRQTCWPCFASGMEARQGGDAFGSVHDRARPGGDAQSETVLVFAPQPSNAWKMPTSPVARDIACLALAERAVAFCGSTCRVP
jgi:hypothetical protein